MRNTPFLLLIQSVTTLLAVAALVRARGGSRIPAVIVFGDSSVDPGNNNYIKTIVRSDFAPYGRDFPGGRPTGRFSNGRLASDFISEALGIKPEIPAYLDPKYTVKDFATGVSFASAATGLDNATSLLPNVIPLWKEVEYYREYQEKLRRYMGKERANRRLRDALYDISIGTNDFIENYFLLPVRPLRFAVEEYEDFLVGIVRDFIREIYRLGGRKFAMTSLPPIGCLPLERAISSWSGKGGCKEEYNQVAVDFNRKLRAMLNQLNSQLRGSSIAYVDVYTIWTDILEKPSSFGFENSEAGCCATGEFEIGYLCNKWSPFTCTDASKYVFWDAVHPTQKTYKIIADYIFKTALA